MNWPRQLNTVIPEEKSNHSRFCRWKNAGNALFAYLLNRDGRLPKDMPVILDSPLAIRSTEIFRRYRSYLDGETQSLLKKGEDPLDLPQLQFLRQPQTPCKLMKWKVSNYYIPRAAWPMPEGSSIIWSIFVAFGRKHCFCRLSGGSTPGRRIVDGAKTIRIFNEDIAIKAKVWTINVFPPTPDRVSFWMAGKFSE